MFVSLIAVTKLNAQDHSPHDHSHAPGHCPACNFDPAKATEPTTFEGEVENWYSTTTTMQNSTNVLSLTLALFAGGALLTGMTIRKRRHN